MSLIALFGVTQLIFLVQSTIETLEKEVKYVQSFSSVSIVGFEQVNLN